MTERPNEQENLGPKPLEGKQYEPTFMRALWQFLADLGCSVFRTVGRSTMIALLVSAPVIHALTVGGGVLALLKVGECPYDAVGEPASTWYFVSALILVYFGVLAVALVCFTLALLGRKSDALRTDLIALPLKRVLGVRFDATLIVHPLLTVFAVALLYITYAAGLGYAVFDFAGNRCRWVRSDLGAERRAHNQEHVFASNLSDRGLDWVARGSVPKVSLSIDDAPAITPKGLAAFTLMQELVSIKFSAHGAQREWGDEEATLITSSPALKSVELHDLRRLTNAWLFALAERSPSLSRVSIRGSAKITEERLHEFRRLHPKVTVSVGPSFELDTEPESAAPER